MPISVRYLNDDAQECVIRPTPLVSIGTDTQRNAEGNFGTTYRITLSGYIIVDLGFPLAVDSRNNTLFPYFADDGGDEAAAGDAGPYNSFDTNQSHSFQTDGADNRPRRQNIPYESALDAMLFKQRVLRSLFKKDGQRFEISPIHTDEPAVICYPRLVSISFQDGIYTDICQYTIELTCDTLLNNEHVVDSDGNPVFSGEEVGEPEILDAGGRFIEAYSDEWTLEPDDSLGESEDLVRSYRVSRNISATGKDHYGSGDLLPGGELAETKKQAWEQARDFVQNRLAMEPEYPNVPGQAGSGLLNLVDTYRGFNKSVTESISVDNGTYSVSENWLLASGNSYENFNMSLSTSVDDAFVNVSINGEIKGLTTTNFDGVLYGGSNNEFNTEPYDNALNKYFEVSNSGKFGVGCDIFKRADAIVSPDLNAQPKSLSISVNKYDGSITYALDFDNRPTNILSGVLSESISVNDTYPGDVFATIPVIGRSTGPVLQNNGSRTEYRRDLSLEVLLDYTDVPYGDNRESLLLQKPSLVEPTRSQIIQLVQELSPQYEPGIRKWFLNAPVENWEPKTGRYSLSASWVYELDR